MASFVARPSSGRLATYHGVTLTGTFVDSNGADIIAAAGDGPIVDLANLSEFAGTTIAAATFTAEADVELGVLDVASDESPAADTSGSSDVAGLVFSGPGGVLVACYTFEARAGLSVDPVAVGGGIAVWEPAPGDLVRSVAGIGPDGDGDVDVASLVAALDLTISQPAVDETTIVYNELGELSAIGGSGGSVEPIMLVAEANETLDVEPFVDGLRPIYITVQGSTNETRATIILPDPSEHPGLSVLFIPDTRVGVVAGASVGWADPYPGVLGDLSAAGAIAATKDLDFASNPETFELTVAGTPYEVTLSTDFTGDVAGALGALLSGWGADGAPITVSTPYTDVIGGRELTSAIVTTTSGHTQTIEVTDGGTDDRLGLSALTATAGVSFRGANGGFRGTGEMNGAPFQTHTWPDDGGLRQAAVVSDGTDYVVSVPTTRSEDLSYTPMESGDWPEGSPTNVGQAINTLAAREGGGGSGPDLSDATPQALGTAAAGTSGDAARADHVHAMPDADDVGAIEAQGDAEGLWIGTAAQYAAVDPKSDDVLYIVREV
jgi:hypothetical protein